MKQSAGIILYRHGEEGLEIFLTHPGGPFWARKDLGAWSIPKGEFGPEEEPLAAAQREFFEETGLELAGDFLPLGTYRQSGKKTVHAWAIEGDCDASAIKSNTFKLEYPPESGLWREFPEVDKAQWFTLDQAREKIHKGQVVWIGRLVERVEIK